MAVSEEMQELLVKLQKEMQEKHDLPSLLKSLGLSLEPQPQIG